MKTSVWLKILLPAAVILLPAGSFLLAGIGNRDARIAQELRLLTGAPARAVWARQVEFGSEDVFVRAARFQLVGFDTEDRRGERIILSAVGNYNRPLFTSRGDRIVFSDLPANRIFCVNWDGSGLQELAFGRAVEVWTDPQTGVEWVYRIPVNRGLDDAVATMPLTRFRLDNPAVEELVFDGARINPDNVQLSQDGTLLGGQFPWPEAGVLHVNEGRIANLGKGCWTSLSPDNSYLLWVFDGPHRNLLFHTADNSRKWTVPVNEAPGLDGHEVYHPRWSNQIRFMCMTGPYRIGIKGGGGDVNIYAGRFNETLTSVEEWCQITRSDYADFYPDLWVRPDAGQYGVKPGAGTETVQSGPEERVVITGRLVEATPVPSPEDIAPYTRTLVVYRYAVEQVVSGTFNERSLLVAHWGLVDGKETAPQLKTGGTVRLELKPYAACSELEGERLVMELSDSRGMLFYDVTQEK